MVGRLMVIVADNTIFEMGIEVVPTVIRGQTNSILTNVGNLLTLASSYIAYSVLRSKVLELCTKLHNSLNFQGRVYLSLPFYILSTLGVAVAIASLGLPGTKNINRDHIDFKKVGFF